MRAVVLSTLAGAVIGAAAIQALHAQAKPPVYMVAINEIKDAEDYRTKYLPTAQKTIKDHGGVYVQQDRERKSTVVSRRGGL
ncbi:DUF1330 domain-containing protein [Bradyrhizobium cenepequi]|uniref:DUF1330 domain-containing protein n=1 Tax=Bradyrhizobium cenepequi TaxID=2821403 RepID=UPI001CE36287|nr:DUF1330 domain-containing protein [Bradyrhizobium cenepequi]MCA6111581.1 hypothetical protein [Bradyrhizobium cenepequi]